jgi:protein-S-isoprenylcysteine O-methyltransferase Ste14
MDGLSGLILRNDKRQKIRKKHMTPLIYFSIAFGISEIILLMVKRSKTGRVKTREDRGSLLLMWLFILIGFTAGFYLSKPVYFLFIVIGMMLIFGGVIVRWLAILQLGKSFTVDVAITDAAVLKTDGIYKKLRHPSYSGLIFIIAGFALTMNSIFSFFVFVVPVFLAIMYRIEVEEKVLINEFGDSYLEYKSRTKRVIPGVY